MVCPSCGRENPEGNRFCGSCGTPLDGAADAQTRKTVTVLFIDLSGFTSMAERLDPERVRSLVGRYLEEMKAVAESHGGTVEKFIGDAVMAVFGVPTTHEDDALRAVRAAWDMLAALERMNESVRTEHGFELTAHAGINTGEVIVGDTSGDRLVTGDAVNVAARLQSAAGAGEILIGDSTYQLVRSAVTVVPVQALDLKGKAEPVPAHRLTGVDPAAAAFERRLDQPLVGRTAELQAALDAFGRAADARRCELVTIVGPPGLGKSRLTAEVLRRIGAAARILVGRCLPYGEGITFWPVAEAIRQAAGITEDDTADQAIEKIEGLVAGDDAELIRRRIAAAIGLGGEGGSLQETFWAVRRLLESLAAERPVAFVVEDVHWAEPALLDLLEYLVEFTSGAAVFVLVTARPEVREARPDWGRAGETITLQPLDREESAALVENLLGSAGIPDAVIDQVAHSAEGNPLFAEELLRKLRDDGLLVRSNGEWTLQGDLGEVAIPGTISALLASRIDGLPEGERSTVQRGSVVGRVFWWRAVEALAPEPERTEVGSHLRTLVRKEVIHPERDPAAFVGEDAFAFAHILVRDAAYDSTPKGVRADLHELFAGWMEHTAGDRVQEYEEIVGYHLGEAARYRRELSPGDPRAAAVAQRAGEHLLAAGTRAEAHGDTRGATSLLGRAVDLLPEDDPRAIRALILLGDARFDTGLIPEAIAALDEATARARRIKDEVLENVAVLRRVYVAGHYDVDPDSLLTFRVAREAAEKLESLGDREAMIDGRAYLGINEFVRGDSASGVRWLRSAIELSRELGRPIHFAGRWLMIASVHGPTPVDEALGFFRDLEKDAPPGGGLQESLLRNRAVLEYRAGRFDDARESLRRAREIATELGRAIALAGGDRNAADLEESAGNPAEAERFLRRGIAGYESIHDYAHGTSLASRLAKLLAKRGAVEEARRSADLGRSWLTPGDIDGEAEWLLAESSIARERGDLDAALAHADRAVDVLRSTDYLTFTADALLARGAVLEAMGRVDQAVADAREGREVARRKGDVRFVRAADEVLARLAPGEPTGR